MKTYSESGGTVAIKVYLLFAGTFLYPTAIPIPQGASSRYFFIAAWFAVRTLAEASFLLKALLIRRICWFPFPIFVKIRINANIANTIETGIAIFKDFDKKTYAIKPAIREAIAVRVPVGNIAHAQASPVIKKNILCDFILLVMPNMINATAVEAIPIPKVAASLKMDQ